MRQVHEFGDALEFTRGIRQQTDIATIRDMLPGCVSIVKTDVETDRRGIDYIATLRRGAEVCIDAKTRRPGASRWWKHGSPELPLEIWSVCPSAIHKGKTGWTLSEASPVDMILFTFDASDSDEAYLIGFQSLRSAFVANFHHWCGKYDKRKEDSGRWRSECVFVPAPVVLDAIREVSQGTTILRQRPDRN